ncbi:MAG: hypothetical protein MUF53_05650 [Gemmatimonadaceae bacterium]|jgi:hypothetical protein|nr:hypothetical protein [Gemmatimonadaceae bacterium]
MRFTSAFAVAVLSAVTAGATACTDAAATAPDVTPDAAASVVVPPTMSSVAPAEPGAAVLMVVDDDGISHGAEPTFFTEADVNADSARKDQRGVLPYFAANVGRELELWSGSVGDEAFHVLPAIPASWRTAGPTTNGARNFVMAGPGLGGNDNDDRLDKVGGVVPLRATGLAMLRGVPICAVVLKGDVGMNYAPRYGSLKGEALGLAAFEIVSVTRRRNGSSTDLPRVTIRIRDTQATCGGALALLTNAPAPRSSSSPTDLAPAATVPAPTLMVAP